MSIKSFEELDEMLKCNEFKSFVKSGSAGRAQMLREYGIDYNGVYRGKFNKTTNTVEIIGVRNPFAKGLIKARLVNKNHRISDGEIISVILTSFKSKSNQKKEYTPQNIFACKLTDEPRTQGKGKNKTDYGGLPVYSKKEIEEDLKRIKEERRQQIQKLEREKFLVRERKRQEFKKYLESRNRELQEVIARRKIRKLVHFTRAANLESILENGICTVDWLREHNTKFWNNDKGRYDRCTDCVNLTIEFHNSRNLISYMQNDACSDWTIIYLDVELLFNQENYYSGHNASTREISDRIRAQNSIADFEMMFAEKLTVTKSMGEQMTFNRLKLKGLDYLPTSD